MNISQFFCFSVFKVIRFYVMIYKHCYMMEKSGVNEILICKSLYIYKLV